MSKKMTKQEFDIIAESWYQRTHRLREYSEDENNCILKRSKARVLFYIMIERMKVVVQIAIRLSQPLKADGRKPGGKSEK